MEKVIEPFDQKIALANLQVLEGWRLGEYLYVDDQGWELKVIAKFSIQNMSNGLAVYMGTCGRVSRQLVRTMSITFKWLIEHERENLLTYNIGQLIRVLNATYMNISRMYPMSNPAFIDVNILELHHVIMTFLYLLTHDLRLQCNHPECKCQNTGNSSKLMCSECGHDMHVHRRLFDTRTIDIS